MSTSFHRIRGANASNGDELPSLFDMFCCCLAKEIPAAAPAVEKSDALEEREPCCAPLLQKLGCASRRAGDGSPETELELAKRDARWVRYKILGGTWAVLFVRYCIATMISPFFPQRAEEDGIEPWMNGLIFAAYPLGMAITSAFAARLIIRIGTRASVIAGMSMTAITTVGFGLVPDVMPAGTLQWGFLTVYFINGLFGALAETAVITKASAVFRDDALGAVMASIGTVCGVGCMVGPPIGGQLSDLPGVSEAWLFRIPFLFFAAICVLLILPTPLLFPADPNAGKLTASHDGATRSNIREQEAFLAGRSAGRGIRSSVAGHNRTRLATGASASFYGSAGSFGSVLWSGGDRQYYSTASIGGGGGGGGGDGCHSGGGHSAGSSSYGSTSSGVLERGEERRESSTAEISVVLDSSPVASGNVVDTTLYDTPSARQFTASLAGSHRGSEDVPSVSSLAASPNGVPTKGLPIARNGNSCVALWNVLPPSFCLSLFAIGLNGTLVATLSPNLAYRLGEGTELKLSSSVIGWMLSISSISYIVTSLPVGWIVDRFPGNSRVCKAVQGSGLLVLCACFALLGPFTVPGDEDLLEPAAAKLRPSLTLVVVGMILKGIGSSGNNAGFSDLVIGVPDDDEYLNALIAGLWNSAYAIGWAAGPFLGGLLYQAFGDFGSFASTIAIISFLCVVFFSLPPLSLSIQHHRSSAVSLKTSLSRR